MHVPALSVPDATPCINGTRLFGRSNARAASVPRTRRQLPPSAFVDVTLRTVFIQYPGGVFAVGDDGTRPAPILK